MIPWLAELTCGGGPDQGFSPARQGRVGAKTRAVMAGVRGAGLAIALMIAVAGNPAWSQAVGEGSPGYIIKVWPTDEGPPNSPVVTAILQTRDGYLWLGTLNGLVRFDGLQFTVFDESNTPGLESSRIVTLFEDSRSNLWVGTETAGVVRIQEGRVIPVGIGVGSADRRLLAAAEDSFGGVWLYTADGQLWRFADERFTVFLFGQERLGGCRAIAAERPGPVWIGTDTRLAALNPAAATAQLEPPIEREVPVAKLDFLLGSRDGGVWRFADGRVRKLRNDRVERDLGTYPWSRVPIAAACEDLAGNLVVGTLGAGVFWYDAAGLAHRISRDQGLSRDIVLSLCADREGDLWVGTDNGGLNRVKRQAFEVLPQAGGVGVEAVQSVCEGTNGDLWVGSNGGGLARFRNGYPERFGRNQGLANLHVWSVYVDRAQQVWAGTYGGGLFRLQDDQFQPVMALTNREISALHEDDAGRLWVGTQEGLACKEADRWRVFTTRDGLSADDVRALAHDQRGDLWVGTWGGGLNRLRGGTFSSFHKRDGLPGEEISSLYLDAQGILWVGTAGGGLGRFAEGRWTRFTTREGLINNSIASILEDHEGYLWLASLAGIMRVARHELNDFAASPRPPLTCRVYGRPDGLPSVTCTMGSQPGACRSRTGRLWFPTAGGLVSVQPGQLRPNRYPPPVKIESVLIDDQPQMTNALSVADSLVMPAGAKRLEIRYTSLNFAAPDKARFRFRLEPYEADWTEAGNTRQARYTRIPQGKYRFQVKACNEDGVWNEAGAMLALEVEPPIWRTWWFLVGSAAAALGLLIGIVRHFSTQKLQRQVAALRQQEALEKERARIARDIHDQLGASLTQLSLLGELVEDDKNSPAEVEGHARQISQTARDTTRTLDEIVWTVNPSNDTLDGLINYVCKYAQEYLATAGLRYRLEVPPVLPDHPISPEVRHHVFLAAKEAITNVVRHAKAKSVSLRLRLDSRRFTLEIADDGVGPAGITQAGAQSRNGLRNMRRRMEESGGAFSIEPGAKGGTVVSLTAAIAGPG